VEFEQDDRLGLVGRRARRLVPWPGLDRAALLETDDGLGRRLPILVAVPASTFAGARLAVELVGGWRDRGRTTLLGRVEDAVVPVAAVAGMAAGVPPEATWLEQDAARSVVREAGRRYRERRAHARIMGGRAWQPTGSLPAQLARFTTPHSAAEYRLSKLPPRFLRGLEGLLDDDERILYWIERPVVIDLPLVRRLRRDVDRRAALIALTDRQVLWLVDHARPDRYLSDWGVDIELIPLERLRGAAVASDDVEALLTVTTVAGERTYRLPAELEPEVTVMCDLLRAFTPAEARGLPLRRYEVAASAFDPEPAERFGQAPAARRMYRTAADQGAVTAALYVPTRPGQRQPVMLVLRPSGVELVPDDRPDSGRRGPARGVGATIALGDIIAIRLTLSPLVGEISIDPRIHSTYPAPMSDAASAFVRLARRALANLG
jgi:hypothetical protein